jgi:peptidoglycan hydrolase CwlO-like protein
MDQDRERLFAGIEKLGTKFDLFASNTSDRLTKIETMFSMFDKAQNNLSNKVENVDKAATEALASTKSAHKRMDDFEGDLTSKPDHDALKARVDKLDKIIFWLGTTVIGAVILAVLGMVIVQSQ